MDLNRVKVSGQWSVGQRAMKRLGPYKELRGSPVLKSDTGIFVLGVAARLLITFVHF